LVKTGGRTHLRHTLGQLLKDEAAQLATMSIVLTSAWESHRCG